MLSATPVEDGDPQSPLLAGPSDAGASATAPPPEARRRLSLEVGASYPIAPPLANYPIQPQPSPPPSTMHAPPSVDRDAEDAYWRFHFRGRPYIARDVSYERFRPAFQFGWESFAILGAPSGRSFADVEHDLAEGWATHRGECCLDWDDASPAARDAWFHAAAHRPVARDPQSVPRLETNESRR